MALIALGILIGYQWSAVVLVVPATFVPLALCVLLADYLVVVSLKQASGE